jgi:hypothetical protein
LHKKILTFSLLFFMAFLGKEISGVYSQAQRRAILLRGNEWVRGVPGFGENAFPAIFGAYRLDDPDREMVTSYSSAEEAAFSVWVCHEALFFDDNWQLLPDIGGYPARRYLKDDNLFLAISFDSRIGRPWDAVFIFARDIPDNSWLNQFIEAWIIRFLHFLTETDEQLSLPAIVSY